MNINNTQKQIVNRQNVQQIKTHRKMKNTIITSFILE